MKTPLHLKILVIGSFAVTGGLFIYMLMMQYGLKLPVIETGGAVSLPAVFLTGLLTGGLTCMAVQGGLLAATIAQREEQKLRDKAKGGNAAPIVAFLVAKIVAYTLLGLLLGWLGSFFTLSITAQVILQIAVAIFMIGTALNILNVHPIFRYFILQPPKFLTRMVRKQSKSDDLFAPVLLGAFTVFIPCGTTQAMMALSVASGSPLLGAAILLAFTLGTSPVFFILGYFTTKLSESLHAKFMRFAALAILVLALFNFSNALSLAGVSVQFPSGNTDSSANSQVSDNVTISVLDYGYDPSKVTVKAGSQVTFTIKNDGAYSCAAAFAIPYYNYQKIIRVGTSETVTLTMPDKPTQIPFMCSMGMYRGVIDVI